MKLSLMLLLCFTCSVTVADDANPEEQLQLTTSIVEQRYCSSTSLLLTLRLNFTNVGQQPIILYKDSSVIGRYMVSRNPRAAMRRRYESRVTPSYSLLGSGVRFDIPDESLFVTLRPGESHSLEKTIYLSVSDGTGETDYLLRAGNHVLQVAVSTWYHHPELIVGLREQWRQRGFLWTNSITSAPMPFTVDRRRQIVSCS